MKTNVTRHTARTLVFALGLLLSAVSSAHGGWHGGGGGWHGGGWHGGGWHGGGWHGGGWHGAGWGGGWGGVGFVGVPLGGYYAPACRTVRVCNYHGNCWLQRSCY